MISHIEVRTSQGALLDLQLGDTTSGIIVEDVVGLDPVKASIVTAGFATMDGTQYQSSRRENRNILLKLALEPDYVLTSVRDLRKQLYNFFMPKSSVSLRVYMSDGLTVDITGRVEYCQSALFTRDPKVDISILCFDPDFMGIVPVVLTGNTVSNSTETPITYDGSTETGFNLVINTGATRAFTIYNRAPDNSVTSLDFSADTLAGDVITVNTVSGNKYITLTRAGVGSSVLYGMNTPSSWVVLAPGLNYFRVYALGSALPYTLTYTPRYGGL